MGFRVWARALICTGTTLVGPYLFENIQGFKARPIFSRFRHD
jgi:hypothetical protein